MAMEKSGMGLILTSLKETKHKDISTSSSL